MGEVGVCGNPEDSSSELSELSDSVRECDDFRGTDEGEVERVEVQNHVLALVIIQAHLFELPIHNSLGFESGGRLLNLSCQTFGRHRDWARLN